MNTANLQIEGLLLALARLIDALRVKGLLTDREIEAALTAAEDAASREAAGRNISSAQAEAVRFPIRFLKVAASLQERTPTFTDITCLIGEARDRS